MSKPIISILVASLLLIFVAGCGGGGGDSASSLPQTQTIPTDENLAPVANAGGDQAVTVGSLVDLNGTDSYGENGDTITYEWVILEKPPGSLASLSDPTAVTPTFVADKIGTYVIELTVSDSQLDSIDEVVVTSENLAPVADAGGGQTVLLGDTVNLDGSGSIDADGDGLTYSWNIVSVPEGSSLTELIGSDTVSPSLTPDIVGTYVISLVVNDGLLDSAPSNVTIYVIDDENTDELTTTLMTAITELSGLDDSDFKNPNNRNSLIAKIMVVVNDYLANGYTQTMLDKLKIDIVIKMDGCALGGEVDTDDWIINCSAQGKVYPLIMNAIEKIEENMSS